MSAVQLPAYNLICIPLDGRDPSKSKKRFELRVVTELQFPAGTAIPSGALHDVAFQHPLFSVPPGTSIRAQVWDFALWSQNGRVIDKTRAHSVQLRPSNARLATDIMDRLSSYLSGDKLAATATSLEHDARIDSLTTSDFVDVAKGADQLKQVTESLRAASAQALAFKAIMSPTAGPTDPNTSSVEAADNIYSIDVATLGVARWLDAAVHSSLVEAFRANADREHPAAYHRLGLDSVAMTGVQEVITKIAPRMSANGDVSFKGLASNDLKAATTSGTDKVVSRLDINAAIHAALRNDLLAGSCGFSSNWIVEADIPIGGDRDWIIQIDPDSLVVNPAIVTVQQPMPTIFRRRGHTHPLAFSDLKATTATNCGFAALNADDGSVRYRASSIHAEKALVKQVIVQSQNSLVGPSATSESLAGGVFASVLDTRAPQLLNNQQYGSPEPETNGVVFSAPPEDLITPKDLSNAQTRPTTFPCFFLEDLWIGYRLDLKKDTSKNFNSIHTQTQRITLRGSREIIEGPGETFIDREQPDDPKFGSSSTNLTTYAGLSGGQIRDYLVFLGLQEPSIGSPDDRFTTETVSYGSVDRLLFGHSYEYQLRNVFRGANSLDVSALEYVDETFIKTHRQKFPFYRARALRPGELLFPANQDDLPEQPGSTIYISHEAPTRQVYLVPTPIDVDTSRYHGVLLEKDDEPSKYKNRKYVTDLTQFFNGHPPDTLDYFYDPDVFGVSIYVIRLNGDELDEPEEVTFHNGVYCRLAKHTMLPPLIKQYGKQGSWEDFKGITLTLKTSSDLDPHINSDSDSQVVEITVPAGVHLKVVMLPLFERTLALRNASHAASSAQLLARGQSGNPSVLFNIPAIAEQTIEVIHALDTPRFPPVLTGTGIPQALDGGDTVSVPLGKRDADGMSGSLIGRVELDAATTKELSLTASWFDINDSVDQTRFTLAPASSVSALRSVVFQPYTPIRAKSEILSAFVTVDGQPLSDGIIASFRVGKSSFGFTDQFALQCAENKVFLGEDPDVVQQPDPNGDRLARSAKKALSVDLKDSRRKVVAVRVSAVSRYADKVHKLGSATPVLSDEVRVDFPSSSIMTSPVISHIIPLRKSEEQIGDHSGEVRAVYGFRIYVEKPFFESGPGERLAIGCLAGEEIKSSTGTEALHYVTKWGEDPVERAGLDITTRMPKASDFSSPKVAQDASESTDTALYPLGVVGGQRAVIYRDNLRLPGAAGDKPRWVSTASFAVAYDQNQALWYADVLVNGGFFGVCGLALYRHQPHALPGHELSQKCAWAYASVLYGELITWVEKDNNLKVIVGPVYDRDITFDVDSLSFQHNVSGDLTAPERVVRPVKTYNVGRERYFEVIVPKSEFNWSLVKKRYGIPFASMQLNRKHYSSQAGDAE
jgi:hypothetical protein